jgi:hypothetical protein
MSAEPRFTMPYAPLVHPASRIGAWAGSLALAAGAFVLARFLAPLVNVAPVAAFAVGFGCVTLAALAAGFEAPAQSRALSLAASLAPALVLLLIVFVTRPSTWLAALCVFVTLLAAGSTLGGFVGGHIQHPGHLLFVAIASSLADVFSVTQPEGLSAAIVQSEAALSVAALSFPMLGTRQIEPLLGVGDVVFTALYLAAARRHGLPLLRSVLSLAFAFFVTMLAVIVFRAPVPALPFLGAAMLITQPRVWQVPERDRWRGFVALLIMASVLLTLMLRR